MESPTEEDFLDNTEGRTPIGGGSSGGSLCEGPALQIQEDPSTCNHLRQLLLQEHLHTSSADRQRRRILGSNSR
ncbi:hypothetical protein Pcinc_004133 [Petrolisthes cinctipes]|uniref:Uncharacterized protein n=1 Tax=Petrolisthes cinctipes TaxID=88211 RepID=A0AAE1GM32_PETCI|nr:hypothetical protein Pcinc_004133 [Petrolisthes cinctipes]